MTDAAAERPDGIDGSALPGPYPVGVWAKGFQEFLRGRPRVQLFGEVWNLRRSRAKAYFELRDGEGAAQCSIWGNRLDALGLPEGALADGAQVVVAGGPDYYPGSRTASPGFSFDVTGLRVAGEGDLLAQLAELRRRLEAEGLFAPAEGSCPRPVAAAHDRRRHRRGRQGARRRARRPAAPRLGRAAGVGVRARAGPPRRAGAVTRALQDLAAIDAVDVIVVARGGGSLADLFAFSDETLCRTVALLRVPVIATVGHHTDRMLIDDVAAVSCSTPTHAAEAAVPLDLRRRARARARGRPRAATATGAARSLDRARDRWPATRASRPTTSRASGATCTRRCASCAPPAHRRTGDRRGATAHPGARAAPQGDGRRRSGRRGAPPVARGPRRSALAAHDPRRVLERGYAMVDDRDGDVVTTAAQAREAGEVRITFADGSLGADDRGRPDMTDDAAHVRDRHAPAWRRSSGAWTPARPACARRSTSSRRAAAWSSTAPASSTRSARDSRSCASTSSSPGSRPRAHHHPPTRRPAP